MSSRILAVDPIACRAHGLCADEFPEAITLDEWRYPILPTGPLTPPTRFTREIRRDRLPGARPPPGNPEVAR